MIKKNFYFYLLLVITTTTIYAGVPECADVAIVRSKKLLWYSFSFVGKSAETNYEAERLSDLPAAFPNWEVDVLQKNLPLKYEHPYSFSCTYKKGCCFSKKPKTKHFNFQMQEINKQPHIVVYFEDAKAISSNKTAKEKISPGGSNKINILINLKEQTVKVLRGDNRLIDG